MLNKFLIILSLMIFPTTSPYGIQIGGHQSKVRIIKEANGAWQLLVNGQPYFIKGVVFTPVKIGESPGDATMPDWMYYNDNHDGRNTMAYHTWLDKNHNNRRDKDETEIGDFRLLKDLGDNTI